MNAGLHVDRVMVDSGAAYSACPFDYANEHEIRETQRKIQFQTTSGELVEHHTYHLRQNDYRCKSLINSKTISVSKNTEIIFAELINSKDNNVRMKLQTLQILQIFIECMIMVG